MRSPKLGYRETKRRILWTGGFDSTWLVIDALLSGAQVETVTLRGLTQYQKTPNEDAARARIQHGLPGTLRSRLFSQVYDTRYESIVSEMRSPWNELWGMAGSKFEDWSEQAPLLCAIPPATGRMEVGHVREDKGPHWRPRWAYMNSRGLDFPIEHLSKPELLRDAQNRGFSHLLAMTWSCEDTQGPESRLKNPSRVACGNCEPCEHRIMPQYGYGKLG